jgi:hypothetical protein
MVCSAFLDADGQSLQGFTTLFEFEASIPPMTSVSVPAPPRVATGCGGGDHCASPDSVMRAQWQFLQAHPFGVEPEPYADALPDSFPDECQVIR